MEDGRCLLDVIGDPDALDLFLDREADGQASAAATEAGLLNASTAYPGLLQTAHCTSTVTASLQEAHTQAGVQQLTQAGHTGQTQVFSSHLQPQPQLVVSQAVTSYALPQLIASHTTAQLIAANSSATQLVANQADTRLAASGQKILVTSLNGQVPVWPTTGIQPQCMGQLTAATPASSTGLVQNSFSRASPQVVQQNSTQFRPVVSVCAPTGGQPVIVQACPSTQQWQPQATSQQSTVSAVNVTQLQQPGGGVGQQVAAVKPPSLVASQGGLQLGQVGMQLIQTSLGNKLLIPSQPLVAGLNGQQLNVTTLRGLQMAPQQQQQLGQVVNAAVQPTVKSAPVTQGVATPVAPTHIILQQGQQPVIAPNQNIIFRAMPSNIVQLQQGVVQGTPRQGNPSQPILITSQLPSLQLQQQLLQQQQQLVQQPQQQQLSLSSSVPTTHTTTAAQVNQNLKPGNILVNIGGQNVSVTLDQLQRLQQQLQQQQQQQQQQLQLQQQQLQQQQQQQQQQVKKIANFVNSPVQILPGTPQQPQTIMLTMQQLQQLQQRMQQQPQQQVIVNKQQTQPVLTVPVGMTTSTLTTATAKTKLIQSNCDTTNGIQAMPTQSFIGSPQKQPLGGQTTSANNVGHRVLPVVTSSQGIVAASSAPMQAVTATSKAGGQAKLQHPPARIVAPNVNIQTMGLSSKPTYGTKVSAESSWPASQVAAPTAPAASSTVVPPGTGSTTVVNKQLAERLQGQIHVLLSMQYRTEEQQRWLEQLTQMLQKVTTQLSDQGEQAINGGQQASQTSTGGTSTTAIRQQVFTPPVIQVAPLVVASGTSAVTTTVTAALTATMTPMLGTPKLQTAVTTGGVTNTQQQQQQQQQQASWASLPANVRERLQAQLAHMTPDQQLLFYKNQDIVLQKLQQQMLKQQQVLKQQQLAAGPVRCQITTSDKRPGTVRTSLAAASLTVNKPILKKPFSKAQLISQQLGRDQQKVVGPNYKTPFKDYTDVVKRLLRYHVFQARENTPDELRKGDELWVEVAEELLEKKRQMLNKYQLLLLNDSMRTIQPSEQVMLQRMFLTEERAQLQRDRHQAREDPLNFKPMPYISRANTAVTTSKCRLSDSTTETSVSDAVHSPVSLSGSPRHGRTGGSKTCVNGPVNCDSDSKCNGGVSPCTYTLQHTDGLKVVFKSSPIHPSSQRYSPSRYSGGEEVTLEGSSRRLDSSGSPRSKRDRPNRVLGSEDNTNKRLRLRDNDDELPFKSYTKNGVDAEYDTQTDSCVVDSEADMAVAGLLSSTDKCTSDNLQTDVSAANTTSGTGAYNWDVTGKQEACNDVPYEEVTDDSNTPTWMYSGGELNMALGGLLSESDPQLVDSDVDALVTSHLEGGNSLGTLQNEMESAVNSIISLGHCNIPGAGLAGSGTPQFGNEQQPQDDLEMAIQSILT